MKLLQFTKLASIFTLLGYLLLLSLVQYLLTNLYPGLSVKFLYSYVEFTSFWPRSSRYSFFFPHHLAIILRWKSFICRYIVAGTAVWFLCLRDYCNLKSKYLELYWQTIAFTWVCLFIYYAHIVLFCLLKIIIDWVLKHIVWLYFIL